ncbi:MAG: winged helix-turn-helix domain-containing protein [Pontixanthobacter sp.]
MPFEQDDTLGLIPRIRTAGQISLDLFHRDAAVGQDWLRLYPREFELLWRLADAEGETLTKAALLEDVWRLGFVPAGNRVEVAVSRIRAKLHKFRLSWMIETGPEGGYRMRTDPHRHDETLDSHPRFGNDTSENC